MPGPVVHHIVAEKVFKKLRASHKLNIKDPQVRASLLLGAQGPDFLFFNLKDWPVVGGTPVADAIGTWFGFLDTVEEIKNGLMAPLKDLDKQLEDNSATYAQVKALVVALKGVSDTLGATVNTALESIVVDHFAYKVFDDFVGHPSQQPSLLLDYTQPGNWWGFDMLHYRRSGLLTQTLFKHARTPAQQAYALGYMTHYAADVVQHPYINLISGGPYRTHGQRHKVIETNQDVLAFNKVYGAGELGASKLFEQYIFSATATPTSIGNINFDRREVNKEVKDLLVKCVHKVHQDKAASPKPLYGHLLKPDQVDMAFSIWLRWFEHSTGFLVDITPPPPVNLTQELADIWTDAMNKVTAAWAGVGSPGQGHGGILGFFEALAAAILVALEVVGALFDSAAALIDALVASGVAIGNSILIDLLRMIQQFLFSDVFMHFHEVLVLQGLAYPTQAQADLPQVKHMRQPTVLDGEKKCASDYLGIATPLKAYRPSGQENEAHLVYPFSLDPSSAYHVQSKAIREVPGSTRPPKAYMNLMSHELIDRFEPTSQDVYDRCAAWGKEAYLDDAIDLAGKGSLGDSVAFSTFVYDRLVNKQELHDFDLDGDRGFGHPSWHVYNPATQPPTDAQPLVIEPQAPNNTGNIAPRHVQRV